MIANNGQNNQLPNELSSTFKELDMFKHLRKAGITKSVGFTCAYLFQLIFCLIFENKNWYQVLQSNKANDCPEKNAVYRFLNKSTFAWRRFLLFLSAHTIEKVTNLTSHDRPKVLIVDDSKVQKLIKSQVQHWIAGLPSYIRAYLPISVCESGVNKLSLLNLL